TAPHENTIEISSSKVKNQMLQGDEQVLHAVLWIHRAYIYKNGLVHRSQACVRLHSANPLWVRTVSDNKNLLWTGSVTFNVNALVAFIGGDDDIGALDGEALEQSKSASDQIFGTRAIARQVEFRTQVVMIEDRFPSKQLVDEGDHDQSVGRIVCVNDVESLGRENVKANDQA